MLGTTTSVTSSQTSAKTDNAISEESFNNVKVKHPGSTLLLTINKPPRNTVSITTFSEINSGLDIAAKDKRISAIIITGSDKVFSAGVGGDAMKKKDEGEPTHASIAREVFNRIECFPKPVIAAINGICANGGNELAMSCDIRVVSKNALFFQQELHLGLIAGFGGMERLQRLVGFGRAMEILKTARKVTADEALNIGLVSSVTSEADLLEQVLKLADTLSEDFNKPAFAVFKERMTTSYNEPFDVALRNDQSAFDRLIITDEASAAIQRFIKKNK